MPQIEVSQLTKNFFVSERSPGMVGALAGLFRRKRRRVEALRGVSFDLEEGDLLGYIGPNGAGKSTTVKILAGILVPDSGSVKVLGRTPWTDRIETVRRIGAVFGQRTQL
jgi:ABC-2 type transport system ATP-binding protein